MYTASEIIDTIMINLPSSITLSDNENAQIPNVTLFYNSIQLQNTSSQSSYPNTLFIVTGFTDATSISTGTNYNRNQSIIKELDSLLNNTIDVYSYESMNTLTAIDALSSSNQSNLITAIKDALTFELSNDTNKFIFDDIAYSISQIISAISVKLPSSISLQNNLNGQIIPVSLLYNSSELSNTSNTTSFSVIGFADSTISQIENSNRNNAVAKLLDSLLSKNINVSN
ncbi:hypothetical protein J6P11_05950 [bacterium]|nr:hypothetical protein [bacterium]